MNQYYSDYLRLDTILNAQHPISFEEPHMPAHDEMLFIIIHQAYELWFKQALFEVESVIAIFQKPALNDNSPEMQTVVHRMGRVNTILKVLVQQLDIMETMTPMDFLDFRDLLRPASGFQSLQFKLLEVRLGLPFQQRHGQYHYTTSLRPEFQKQLADAELQPGLLQLVNNWLERMPFFNDENLWNEMEGVPLNSHVHAHDAGPFWQAYRHRLKLSLTDNEYGNLNRFDEVLLGTVANPGIYLSPSAARAALFIMLYRGYPFLQQPFQLINSLLETDELLSNWRYRHMNMVHRMIGHRVGTGGSSGESYLKGAADKHYIFKDFAMLTSFLIERKNLPALTRAMQIKLGFLI